MRKTFDESQVLFRYPDDNPIPRYVIVKDDSASSKIRVYCLSVGSYREASTGEYKALIAILLTEREEMSKWKTDALQWFEEAAELARQLAALKAELAKANELLDVDRPGGEE